MMKVVYVEPGKPAVIKEIGSELEDMQEAVGGYIEAMYPSNELIALICNEEGKINGLTANRAIIDEETEEIIDIVFGPFFICGVDNEEGAFVSLDDHQARRYQKLYQYPETFFRTEQGVAILRHFDTEE